MRDDFATDYEKEQLPSLKNILKSAKHIGFSGGKVIFYVISAFTLVNLACIAYAASRFFILGFSWIALGMLAITIALGIGFSLYAVSITYRYIILTSLKKVYDLTLQQRISVCEEVISRVEGLFSKQEDVPPIAQLNQVIDWSKIIYHHYQRVPVFFQSGITQYLNRIPIANFIIVLKEDILEGNQSIAAEKLHFAVDSFFNENIIGEQNNKKTWALLGVNVVILYTFINYSVKVIATTWV